MPDWMFAAVVPAATHAVPPSAERSKRKPSSLLELSVQVTPTACGAPAATAFEGATGEREGYKRDGEAFATRPEHGDHSPIGDGPGGTNCSATQGLPRHSWSEHFHRRWAV